MILNTISLPYKTKRPINEIALEGEQQVDYRNDYKLHSTKHPKNNYIMKSSQTPFNKAPKQLSYILNLQVCVCVYPGSFQALPGPLFFCFFKFFLWVLFSVTVITRRVHYAPGSH